MLQRRYFRRSPPTSRARSTSTLRYREGLSAVKISGGVAGNVVPDACTVTINFRFAPDPTRPSALAHVEETLAPYAISLVDSAAGALPGLSAPAARDFISAADAGAPRAKYGWTDVARFAALGIPAVNYGPGDPNLAHTREESIDVRRIGEVAGVLKALPELDVQADVLGGQVLVDALEAALTPEAALLDATEGRRRVGDQALVQPDHAGLQPLDHPHRAGEIAGEHVGDQAEFAVVGGRQCLLLRREGRELGATGPKISSRSSRASGCTSPSTVGA